MNTEWRTFRLETCIKHVKRPTTIDDGKSYRRVTVRLRGQGIGPRDEVLGAGIKTKKQYLVQDSDLLVAEIDAKSGAYGVVPPDLAGAIVSSHYFTYEIDRSRVLPAYLDYWLKTPSAQDQVLAFIRGSLNYAAIRPYHFPQLVLPLPDLDEQGRIVQQIDAVATRIAEAQRLRESVEVEREEMLRAFARDLAKDAPRRPLQEVAPISRRPVAIETAVTYRELGVRSFGRGLFEKPTINGADLTWERPYWMKAGDLLFSNIKAWEGAVAVITEEYDGFVGSHRYITCRPDTTQVTAEFLCHWLLTEEGLRHLGGSSPGATDRNRTLGLKKLQTIPVPVPPLAEQKRVSRLSRQISSMKATQATVAEELKSMLPAVLDLAFRGEL